MSRNYEAIHYIQKQLEKFNSEFVNCVIRCFNLVNETKEPDGCLSNSIALYICAKEYGYSPTLCYGLCELDGVEFYHAWLEIDDIAIDISIYGNINFSPFSVWDYKVMYPYIGSYESSVVNYGRFKFDEDWSYSMVAKMEGWSFERYMNGLPQNAMWKIVCKFLNQTPTANLIEHLKEHIKNKYIERDK